MHIWSDCPCNSKVLHIDPEITASNCCADALISKSCKLTHTSCSTSIVFKCKIKWEFPEIYEGRMISAQFKPPTLHVSLAVLRRSTIDARYVRQLVVAEDGGTIGLDYYHGDASELGLPPDAPVLLVLHGVSGAL